MKAVHAIGWVVVPPLVASSMMFAGGLLEYAWSPQKDSFMISDRSPASIVLFYPAFFLLHLLVVGVGALRQDRLKKLKSLLLTLLVISTATTVGLGYLFWAPEVDRSLSDPMLAMLAMVTGPFALSEVLVWAARTRVFAS